MPKNFSKPLEATRRIRLSAATDEALAKIAAEEETSISALLREGARLLIEERATRIPRPRR